MGYELSVVIPAHNESRTLRRNLEALHAGAPVTLDVVVVCNGCTDDTAQVARAFVPKVHVVEIEQPSKREAVRVGNQVATAYPRVHIDADVEISGSSLAVLTAPIRAGRALATAPRRDVPREGCSLPVRWYYDVWEQLPQVRSGLFGRGVVALSEEGQARISALPPMMSDDLIMSEAFAADEREVVEEAVVVVRPPRTTADLVRRRIRVVTGNTQADDAGLRASSSSTSLGTLVGLARKQPGLAPRLLVFLAITLVARIRARRAVRTRDFTTWQRDESSRQG